jgi:DNA repair exonuclease SbcCD nuclease subunit
VSYRAIFTADVHVSNALPYARRLERDGFGALVTDRLRDTLAVLDQMANAADDARCEDLWVLGDLIDRRLLDAVTHRAVAEKLAQLVDEREKQVILVPGNHEAADHAASAYNLEGFARLRPGKIHVRSEPGYFERDNVPFYALPYKPDAEACRIIDAARAGGDAFLLLHQSLKGGKAGDWVCPDGVGPELLEGFLGVLAGHFHTAQHVGKEALYLGAPLSHHFGDAGERRGFWKFVVDDEDGTADLEMIEARAPRFHVVTWRHGTTDADVDAFVGDYVQLNVVGTRAQLRTAVPEAAAIARVLEASGARMARVHPIPVPERKSRAKVEAGEGGRVTWPVVVEGYLDACDLSGLERARLAEIGRAALAEAEASR